MNEKSPILLDSLKVDTSLDFDLYLSSKQSEDGFVLYRHRSKPFDHHTRSRLIESGVTTVFIDDADRDAYDAYVEKHLDSLLSNRAIPVRQRAEVLYDTVLSQFSNEGLSEESIAKRELIADHKIDLLCQGKDAIHSLVRAMQPGEQAHVHGTNVAILSISLAVAMDLDDVEKLKALALAGYFHDIAEDEYLKNQDHLTAEERNRLQSHPRRAARLLEDLGVTDPFLLNAIREHHEDYSGKGYPFGLAGDEISLGARILAVADTFDEILAKNTVPKIKTYEALLQMIQMGKSRFDPRVLECLIRVLGPGELRSRLMEIAQTSDSENEPSTEEETVNR